MSESASRLANALGPGVPMPGGDPVNAPQPRLPGPMGTPGGGGAPPPNALAAGGGPPTAGGMPTSLEGVRQMLHKEHGQAKAAYDQTGKALGMMDHIRKGLERLADKGDMVTSDDIIEEASTLVGHGIDPMALAGILADMPQEGGGEALGGWIASHAINAAQAEQQMIAAHNVARSQLGASAVHMITAHDAGMMLNGPPPDSGPMDGGNQLGAPAGGNSGPPPSATGHPLDIGSRFMPGAGAGGALGVPS